MGLLARAVLAFLGCSQVGSGEQIREAGRDHSPQFGVGAGLAAPAACSCLRIFTRGLASIRVRVHSALMSHRALGLPCALLLSFWAVCDAGAPKAVPTPARFRLCTCFLICPSETPASPPGLATCSAPSTVSRSALVGKPAVGCASAGTAPASNQRALYHLGAQGSVLGRRGTITALGAQYLPPLRAG